MKRLFYQNRIAVLSVLAGIVYVFMIFYQFSGSRESFLIGWHEADETTEIETQNGVLELSDIYYLNVTPKESVLSFPEQISGTDGKLYDARYSSMKVAVTSDEDIPGGIRKYNLLDGFVLFFVFMLYVILPFRFFKLLSSLNRNDVFNWSNVRCIRQIGWILISLFFLELFASILDKTKNQLLFELSDYTITGYSANALLMLFGVIVLLAGEILAKGVAMEEERQLTI